MKRIGLSLVVLFVCWRATGQGQVWFANWGNWPSVAFVTNACTGQLVPPGSNLVAGLYMAELGQLDERRFALVAMTTNWFWPGLFNGGVIFVANAAGWQHFQVRVWEGDFGSTFEQAALAPPQGGRPSLLGKSDIVSGFLSIGTQPPGSLYLNPFSIGLPECALGGVWFENDSSTFVTNLCTAGPALPDGGLVAGLYYAPDGATNPAAFTLLPQAVPFSWRAGEFHGGLRLLPATTPRGDFALLQIRAWESAFGATYEAAVAAPPQHGRLSLTGTSAVLRVMNPLPGSAPAFLPSNGLSQFVVGFPECLVAGAVLFQNGSRARVTNLCSGETIVIGTNFSAGLYYGPAGETNAARLVWLAPAASFGPLPGEIFGGVRVTPASTAPGELATFQIRVWESSYGATFEEAAAAPPRDGRRALLGQSDLFEARTSVAGTAAPLSSAGTLRGFYVGYPECVVPGSVAFQNSPATLVTNLETGSPVPPGATFLAALYAATDGQTNEGNFVPLGAAVAFGPEPGRFVGGNRVATNVALPGEPAMFQVRVWESAFGASYEQALVAPPQQGRPAIVGKSRIVRVPTLGGGFPLRPPPALADFGLTNFFVAQVGWLRPGTVFFRNDDLTLVSNACTAAALSPGSNFLAALYCAPDGSSNEATFGPLGEPAGIGPVGGLVDAGVRLAPPGVTPGASAWFQFRVWEAAFGATYDEAIAAAPQDGRRALTGRSALVRVRTWKDYAEFPPQPVNAPDSRVGYPFESLTVADSGPQIFNSCTHQTVLPGNPFRAALYYAPGEITDERLFARVGVADIGPNSGEVRWQPFVLPSRLFPGQTAQLQIRVWETSFGASYEEALAAPPQRGRGALTGKSGIGRVVPPPQCQGQAAGAVPPLGAATRVELGDAVCSDQRLRFSTLRGFFYVNVYRSLAAADLNGDSRLDALALETYGTGMALLKSLPNGDYQWPAAHYNFTNVYLSIALGDFDGDGKADLAGANGTRRGVDIFHGNGDTTFGPAVHFPLSDQPYVLVAGDFDGDGRPDLLATSFDGRSLLMLPGRGDGTFGPARRTALGFQPTALAAGDFTEDCLPDAVVASEDPLDLVTCRNRGDGTFSFERSQLVAAPIHALAGGDLNGDSQGDVVVVNQDFTITVFLGQGEHGFLPIATYPVPNMIGGYWMPLRPDSATVGDFDGDGKPDILAQVSSIQSMGLFLNETASLHIQDDSAVTVQNEPVLLNPLANDGYDGTSLRLADLSWPLHGLVAISDRTNVIYAPDPGFVGTDSFSYFIENCNGGTPRSGQITVEVTPFRPQLLLMQSAGGITLHWPAAAGLFIAETTTNLAPPTVWMPVSDTPVLTNGEWVVQLTDSGATQRFFRLRAH